MKAKMMIYAEILRQLAQMPNKYEEPEMESMESEDDMEDEKEEDDAS